MRGTIIQLPQYAFMAWCSVKKKTGTNLPLPLPYSTLYFINLLIKTLYLVMKLFVILCFFSRGYEEMFLFLIYKRNNFITLLSSQR
jgi:hypothetical protein